jgi:peptide/nickel transport system permease protein
MRERFWWLPGGLIAAFCFVGPVVWRVDPAGMDTGLVLAPPGWAHPMGTDVLGRDGLARLMQGGADTLAIAVPAAVIGFVLGVAYGLAAGLGPAWLDRVLMRVLDAVLALPSLVVLVCLSALVPLNGVALAVLIGAVAWPGLARLVRGEALSVRGRDFFAAAGQMGAGPWHLARVHVLPVLGPLLVVNATFLLGDAILGLSALSFLGLGVQPPRTSWGQLLQDGMGLIELRAWWLVLPPGALIAASLFACSTAGAAFGNSERETDTKPKSQKFFGSFFQKRTSF